MDWFLHFFFFFFFLHPADNNQLTGSIPVELQSLSNLDLVFLEENLFTGGVEEAFCQNGRTNYTMLYAECGRPDSQMKCSCCTHCCNENGHQCRKQQTPVELST